MLRLRRPTQPSPLAVSPGLIEFWLRLRLRGSSSGNAVQHVSRPSMETFGSMTKGVVPVQVAPSRGAAGPLRSLCSISAAPLLRREHKPHKMLVMKGKEEDIRQIKCNKSTLTYLLTPHHDTVHVLHCASVVSV